MRVPEDISVIGFDGIEMGQFTVPKLTTIEQPGEAIAKRCVEILLESIEESKPAVIEELSFSLIVGESTKKIS
jgi:LacI family transcriptional regulator